MTATTVGGTNAGVKNGKLVVSYNAKKELTGVTFDGTSVIAAGGGAYTVDAGTAVTSTSKYAGMTDATDVTFGGTTAGALAGQIKIGPASPTTTYNLRTAATITGIGTSITTDGEVIEVALVTGLLTYTVNGVDSGKVAFLAGASDSAAPFAFAQGVAATAFPAKTYVPLATGQETAITNPNAAFGLVEARKFVKLAMTAELKAMTITSSDAHAGTYANPVEYTRVSALSSTTKTTATAVANPIVSFYATIGESPVLHLITLTTKNTPDSNNLIATEGVSDIEIGSTAAIVGSDGFLTPQA